MGEGGGEGGRGSYQRVSVRNLHAAYLTHDTGTHNRFYGGWDLGGRKGGAIPAIQLEEPLCSNTRCLVQPDLVAVTAVHNCFANISSMHRIDNIFVVHLYIFLKSKNKKKLQN